MKLPDDIDGHDLHQWLRGTFFKISRRKHPVQFEMNEGHRVYFRQPDGTTDYVDADRVRLWWPRTGALNIDGLGALYVQRHAARQWRRSFSPRELRLSVPRGRFGHPTELDVLSSADPRLITALNEPVFYPQTEAIGMLEDVPSVAVTRQVMLVRASHSEIAVYYNNAMVGTLEPNGTYIPEGDPRLVARTARALARRPT